MARTAWCSNRIAVALDGPFQVDDGQIIPDRAGLATEIGPGAVAHLFPMNLAMMIDELIPSSEPPPLDVHEVYCRHDQPGHGLDVMPIPGGGPGRDERFDGIGGAARNKVFSIHGDMPSQKCMIAQSRIFRATD